MNTLIKIWFIIGVLALLFFFNYMMGKVFFISMKSKEPIEVICAITMIFCGVPLMICAADLIIDFILKC